MCVCVCTGRGGGKCLLICSTQIWTRRQSYIHKSLGNLIRMQQSAHPWSAKWQNQKLQHKIRGPIWGSVSRSSAHLSYSRRLWRLNFLPLLEILKHIGIVRVLKRSEKGCVILLVKFHIKFWHFNRVSFMGMWPVLSHRTLIQKDLTLFLFF